MLPMSQQPSSSLSCLVSFRDKAFLSYNHLHILANFAASLLAYSLHDKQFHLSFTLFTVFMNIINYAMYAHAPFSLLVMASHRIPVVLVPPDLPSPDSYKHPHCMLF